MNLPGTNDYMLLWSKGLKGYTVQKSIKEYQIRCGGLGIILFKHSILTIFFTKKYSLVICVVKSSN